MSIFLWAARNLPYAVFAMASVLGVSAARAAEVAPLLRLGIPTLVVADGAQIITGSFQGRPNSGVVVNSTLGCIAGDTYFANDVPLDQSMQIKVTAIDQFSSKRASVSSVVMPPNTGRSLLLTADPCGGVAPYRAVYRLRLDLPGDKYMKTVYADFEGDGTFEYVSTDHSLRLEHSYRRPGLYKPRFIVTDTDGGRHDYSRWVVVVSRESLEEHLQGLLSSVQKAIAEKNTTKLLAYLGPESRQRFIGLQNHDPDHASAILDLLMLSYHIEAASDTFVRMSGIYQSDSGMHTVELAFFRNDQGLWRLMLP